MLWMLTCFDILNGFDLSSLQPLSPEHTHLLIEALRLAFADTLAMVTDPSYAQIPIETLLSPEYTLKRSKEISLTCAKADVKTGRPIFSSDTVYLSVVDQWGNACSFINSNYMGFGSGLIPKGWGFTLQNRGANFSLDATHPNALAPGKRPFHTIIPGMAIKNGELFASFGNVGGFMQPQGQVQLLVNLIDHSMDPQSALNVPKFFIDTESSFPWSQIYFEEGYPQQTLEVLTQMGHNVVGAVKGLERSVFGIGQIIMRDPANKVLWGGSDVRGDGLALAW